MCKKPVDFFWIFEGLWIVDVSAGCSRWRNISKLHYINSCLVYFPIASAPYVYPNVVTRRIIPSLPANEHVLSFLYLACTVHGSTYNMDTFFFLSFIYLALRRTIRFQLMTERVLFFLNHIAPCGTLEVSYVPSILP